MSTLIHRDTGGDLLDQFIRIERMFDDWMRLPMRQPFVAGWGPSGEDLIHVDEYREGDTEIIRAELPGVDPEKDVEISVDDGILSITAERKAEDTTEGQGYRRRELRYGRFARRLPLPAGVAESDIRANYRDGILEIRVPIPEQPAAATPTRIAIATGD
jgi:HSP20 family protein